MRQTPHSIAIIVGLLSPILMLLYMIWYGLEKFFSDFPKPSLLWMAAILFVAPIIYYVFLARIKRNRKLFENGLSEDEFNQSEIDGDQSISDLLTAYCTKCGEEGFYHFADDTQPHLWICWNCAKESSAVWCDKCGMGGHFVKKISSKPKSWKCPKCKREYSLPENFYDHPIKPEPWEGIPLVDKLKYFRMQRKFQIQQLRDNIVFISSFALSFIWAEGVMEIVKKSISNLFGLAGIYIFCSFGLWFGVMFYYKYGVQFYVKWKRSVEISQ